MFIIFKFICPLFNNFDNIFIKLVLPQPVSPIIITGIPALILNKTKIILIKLSLVKQYDPIIFLISSIDNPFKFKTF